MNNHSFISRWVKFYNNYPIKEEEEQEQEQEEQEEKEEYINWDWKKTSAQLRFA